MAGLFDFGGNGSSGGIFGGGSGVLAAAKPNTWDIVSMVASGLQDANAAYRGEKGGYLDANLQGSQGQRLRAALMQGLSSSDPVVRQRAYQAAAMYGIDTKPFQQQQAAQALPKLLDAMKPQQVAAMPAPLPMGPQFAPQTMDYQRPGMGFGDALAASGSPELQAQLAPKLIDDLMKGPDNTPHEGLNPTTGKLGQYVMDHGQPHWLDVGVLPKAPTSRTVRQGLTEITQEFDPLSGTWKEVAKGAAFKPEREVAAPDPKAVDLGVQYFMQYGKLPPTARTPALQTAIMAAASDRLAAGGKTMQDVIQTAQTNNAAGQTVIAFDKGKQGDTVRSLNVSVQHLDTLRELGKALKNGDINMVNAARQKFAEAFGGAAPTNWDAAKAIVADEVAKGVIGGQTAQSDRETLAATLKNSRSPEQAEGAINTFQDLLGGQLRGLRQQYKSSTHRDDFNSKLFPETVRRLDPPKGAASPASLPQKPPSGWTLHQDAQGRRAYVSPDGKQFIKAQ